MSNYDKSILEIYRAIGTPAEFAELKKMKAVRMKDPNERICPHCNSIGYSAYEDAKCHKCGLRPKEDKK